MKNIMDKGCNFDYTVIIRTLGKAGDKYQKTLNSLANQTVLPKSIFVYIAEGYPIPKEAIGKEKYIYVKKGMVAQRALPYTEVETEYCLFLDDDVYLPPNGVEKMYSMMNDLQIDVISPDVFFNDKRAIGAKIKLFLLGNTVCRFWGTRWGYKVLRTGGFSYKNKIKKDIFCAQSNTGAGPCFFMKKEAFLSIHFEEELWLDKTPYAFPDDQIMFYKMYKKGLKIATLYNSGIQHLDAGTSFNKEEERALKSLYSACRNQLIFWHRFIYKSERRWYMRFWAIICVLYAYTMKLLFASTHLLRSGGISRCEITLKGIKDALIFLRSDEYKALPLI